MQYTKVAILVVVFCSIARWLPAQPVEVTPADIRYASVTAINAQSVEVTDASAFNVTEGDIVLIIQMKGATYQNTPPQRDGYDPNDAGRYEFLMVEHVTGNEIFFVKPFLRTYTVTGNVQLVTVPYAEELSVNTALNVPHWGASNTGGVLALIGLRKITINAGINAAGAGFRGANQADDAEYTDGCNSATTEYILTTTPNASGLKGEGVHHPVIAYNRGRGYILNGGGAGNGLMSGGGGGGGYGSGGRGGKQKYSCAGDVYGMGGSLNPIRFFTKQENRLVAGGGGGTGTFSAGTNSPRAGMVGAS